MFDVVGRVSKEQRVGEVYDLNFWIPLLTFMTPAHISEWAGGGGAAKIQEEREVMVVCTCPSPTYHCNVLFVL